MSQSPEPVAAKERGCGNPSCVEHGVDKHGPAFDAAYEPGQTCPECGALVGHWKPCSNASPELQERWSNLHESVEGAGEAVDGAEAQPTRPDEPVPGDLFDSEAD